jgi:hypothetical protein
MIADRPEILPLFFIHIIGGNRRQIITDYQRSVFEIGNQIFIFFRHAYHPGYQDDKVYQINRRFGKHFTLQKDVIPNP